MADYPNSPGGSGGLERPGLFPNSQTAPPPTPMSAPGKHAELGRPANLSLYYSTRGDRQWQPKWLDPNPALQFPFSVQVFTVMTRTDDEVDSVMRAVTLPIQDAPWDLDDSGVKPDVAQFVRDEIGLPEPGEVLKNRQRGQGGIVFADHLRETLDCLAYGFMPFEQVYEPSLPGDPGHPDIGLFTDVPCVHLRKLASRHPSTIRRIRLDHDGGLVSVIQYPPFGEPEAVLRPDGEPGVEIPVDRLVMYVNDRKGADWSGVSILRTAYAPWKIKEQMRRLDAIAAERNSLGMPVVHYDPTVMDEDAALALAAAYRSGAEAGIAMPPGASIEIIGVSGTVPDLGPKINQYNEAIGRASLAMFLNLGHDNGARSLGDTFLSFFTRSLQTIARQIAQTFTEHVIRDLVEWNFGADEVYPRLVPGEITTDMALNPAGLAELIKANVIVPDDLLEANQRARYRLPTADDASKRIPADPKAKFPFQPENEPNPLDPSVTAPALLPPAGTGAAPVAAPNPFIPVPLPNAAPAGDGAPAAASEPVPEPLDPDAPRQVHVPAHDRKWPAGRSKPTLAGYAAWLQGQVTEYETTQ